MFKAGYVAVHPRLPGLGLLACWGWDCWLVGGLDSSWSFMGSYECGYKSPDMKHNFTYNSLLPTHEPPSRVSRYDCVFGVFRPSPLHFFGCFVVFRGPLGGGLKRLLGSQGHMAKVGLALGASCDGAMLSWMWVAMLPHGPSHPKHVAGPFKMPKFTEPQQSENPYEGWNRYKNCLLTEPLSRS